MRKTWMVLALAACLALSLSLALGACEKKGGNIVGAWIDEAGLVEFQFTADGTLIVNYPGTRLTATYSVDHGELSIEASGPNAAVLSSMLQGIDYTVDGDELALTSSGGKKQTLHRK